MPSRGYGGAVKSALLCWFPTLEKLLCQSRLVLQSCCAFQARFWSCWLLAEPMYTTEPVRQCSGRRVSRYGEFLSSQPPPCPWEPNGEGFFLCVCFVIFICTSGMEKQISFPSSYFIYGWVPLLASYRLSFSVNWNVFIHSLPRQTRRTYTLNVSISRPRKQRWNHSNHPSQG